MTTFLYEPQSVNPKGKPRVYFTCHPEDFDIYFEKIKNDILRIHDCVIYYTEDMTEIIDRENLEADLGQMNLFVVPVTLRLLTEPSRAMDQDIAYAKEHNIHILPFMMETGMDELYSSPEKFGERQYLSPYSTDLTEIRYENKLKNHMQSVLISDNLAQRIRAAFDAYIFLSYRKKDRCHANELMKMIHKNPECRDIAIWYDEFLVPGESFSENIKKALDESNLFALLVTPNLLEEPGGKPNYVMAEEYPAAKDAKKVIFPAEMEPTDHELLKNKYQEIPECVDPTDEQTFKERLLQTLEQISITVKDGDSEHKFLIGLAYLEGIDVEVDQERGVSLMTEAAEGDLPEAMEQLIRRYTDGTGVTQNKEMALYWSEKLAQYYFRESFSPSIIIQNSKPIHELFTHYEDSYWSLAIKTFLLLVDAYADSSVNREIYTLLESFGICEYTLLFETCKNMKNHKEATEIYLVDMILQRSVDGTDQAYGPLFWYIPEFDLYETALMAVAGMEGNAKAAALVRDVCFIFGQYDCVAEITDKVDGEAIYQAILPKLQGVRRALCQLFYTGQTDYEGGEDIYPRCFNVAEAKKLRDTGIGLSGHMSELFQDELGLFVTTKEAAALSGLVILPYDNRVEEILSGDMRFVRGLILLNTDNIFFDYMEFYRRNLKVMYIPENCREYSTKFARHLNLDLFLNVEPVEEAMIEDVYGKSYAKSFLSASHRYIRKKVQIPVDCEEIKEGYFRDHRALTTVILPENLMRIETRAFYNCSGLTQVVWPDNLEHVGIEAFYGCNNLQTAIFAQRVHIENYAFAGCENLSQICFKGGVSHIGMNAFAGCRKLTDIDFPQGIMRILDYAFSKTGLKTLSFPKKTGCDIDENVPKMYWPMLKLGFGTGIFAYCEDLAEVTLPEDLEKIPPYAFADCKALTKVNLPQKLAYIGDGAFRNNRKLTYIGIVNPDIIVGEEVFIGCDNLKRATLPATLQGKNLGLRPDCDIKWIFYNDNEDSTTSEEKDNRSNSKPLLSENLILDSSVVELDMGAYQNCIKLKTVDLERTKLDGIAEGAFRNCRELKDITMPLGLQSIEEEAFMNCVKLSRVIIPENELWFVGPTAFAGCVSLESIEIPYVKDISDGAFYRCEKLVKIKLPKKIRRIGEAAFALCASLEQVPLGEHLEEIGESAFLDCTSLQSIRIPLSVTSIGDRAFIGCDGLSSIEIGENFRDDIERIFGKVDRKIIHFIDTGHVTHFTKTEKDALDDFFLPLPEISSPEMPPLKMPLPEMNGNATKSSDAEFDDRLDEAIAFLQEKGYLTVSALQRKLLIGYSRAYNMIQILLAKDIIRYEPEYKRYVPS